MAAWARSICSAPCGNSKWNSGQMPLRGPVGSAVPAAGWEGAGAGLGLGRNFVPPSLLSMQQVWQVWQG
jgi:hypothetical protein